MAIVATKNAATAGRWPCPVPVRVDLVQLTINDIYGRCSKLVHLALLLSQTNTLLVLWKIVKIVFKLPTFVPMPGSPS